jgi:uncharacterized protein (TIGR00255 family)
MVNDQIMKEKWQIRSMTGLGRARMNNNDIAIEIVVKSVNYRGRDIRYALANELSFLEMDIGSIVGERLSRGRIEVQAFIESLHDRTQEVIFDEGKAESLLLKFIKFQERFPKVEVRIGMSDLMAAPGLLRNSVPRASPLPKDLKPLTLEVLKEALHALDESKIKEGALLTTGLNQMLKTCLTIIGAIFDAANTNVAKKFEKLKARCKEVFANYEINEERLYQEMALLVERSDFKEEIDRLVAHAAHFDAVCQEPAAKGRKLDFLCQEMLRESNTLLSKAFDHHTALKAIDLKAEIERIREQVQNIE